MAALNSFRSQSPLELSCLRKVNEKSLSEAIQTYLKNKLKYKETSFQMIGNSGIKSADAEPWWTVFTESSSSRQKLRHVGVGSGSTSSQNQNNYIQGDNPDAFENWFSKNPSGSSISWLAGPSKSSSVAPSSSSQGSNVEDIAVPSIYEKTPAPKGRRALKRERKAEREKTLGKKWFEMKAPDVDTKLKNDMELIRMRGVLDPKRFYKHNDRRALPKYFQMGTVVDEGTDFYSSRLTKKQRKSTLVEELMADANIRQFNKRKYNELQQKMRVKKKAKAKK